MKKILILIGSVLLFSSCNNFNNKAKASIGSQQLLYDSLYNKFHKFDIQLYTTLQFEKKDLNRKEYNDFLIVIKNDTFPLVPEVNGLKIKNTKDKFEIDYSSKIDFSSKIYKNDSISNIIKDSYIITSEGVKVEKSKSYKLESLVTLSYKDADVKSKSKNIDM